MIKKPFNCFFYNAETIQSLFKPFNGSSRNKVPSFVFSGLMSGVSQVYVNLIVLLLAYVISNVEVFRKWILMDVEDQNLDLKVISCDGMILQ